MPRRRWDARDEPDPMAGLVNLFDLWMVFALTVLVLAVGANRGRLPGQAGPSPTPEESLPTTTRAEALDRFRLGAEELAGSGEKLGVAYRLASGEVICVPETALPRVGRPTDSDATRHPRPGSP